MNGPSTSSLQLQSSDGDIFIVSREAGELSSVVKSMIECMDDIDIKDTPIPISKVNSLVLATVVEFMTQYIRQPLLPISKPIKSNDMKVVAGDWYGNYIDSCEKQMVYDIILASNYMDIKPLLDLSCCKIATYLFNKKKHEIPAVFGVQCDFTPEDEMEVYKEHPWVREMRDKAEERLSEHASTSSVPGSLARKDSV